MAAAPGPPAVPRATIRLQFQRGFGFDEAAELVPYFAALGVSHVYASPFLEARAGSTHGYDITSHSQFNPEIGDAAAFDRLAETLHAHGMGLILDFVPNHMGVGGSDNAWWLDVLEWGPASLVASFFDIAWTAAEEAVRGKLLVPFLGDHYGQVLERGELVLRFDAAGGTFSIWYHDHRFPIAVRHYPQLLRPALNAAEGGREGALAQLIDGLTQIGAGSKVVQRQALLVRQANELKARLAALVRDEPAVAIAVERTVDEINGTPGAPESFVRLHQLLEDQSYRAAYWRVAADEINYRRFFDINDLAGLRMELPELFELAHQLVFRLIGEGKLQGLRLDHVDGLYDPAAYCERLQDRAAYLLLQAERSAPPPAPEAPGLRLRHPIYLVVEKILARHEHLRENWPVSGTTGYEFMNLVNGLFVDPAGERPLGDAYARFIGREIDFEELVVEAKSRTVRTSLSSELTVLAGELNRLADQSWLTRDYTYTGIRAALIDVVAHFPVYRTYVTAARVSDEDRRYLEWAVATARKASDAPDRSVYGFLYDALSTDLVREARRGYRPADVVRVAMKFQQFTGPVMAKALEDTAFYRYHRLVSLNEVGGEPARFGDSPAAFHLLNQERLRRHPFSMLATATHDHKRGEDTRVRIDVLSELPTEWGRRARRWARLNRFKKRDIEGRSAPGRNDEYLLYQTLVGAWPLEAPDAATPLPADFADRIVAYMTKAVREAKQRSNWAAPDADYEAALERFVRAILDPVRGAGFIADFAGFHRRVAVAGAVNGLAQTLLKLTVPGVPDLYRGTEFWDLSLVDPDNRRPVDYPARRRALPKRPPTGDALDRLVAAWRDGRIKQHVIARTLDLRAREPALFAIGDYAALEVAGRHAGRVVAFRRDHGGALAVTVAPRLAVPLLDGAEVPLPSAERWGDTELVLPEPEEPIALANVLTGESVPLPPDGRLRLADLLGRFPVALLFAGARG